MTGLANVPSMGASERPGRSGAAGAAMPA